MGLRTRIYRSVFYDGKSLTPQSESLTVRSGKILRSQMFKRIVDMHEFENVLSVRFEIPINMSNMVHFL